MKQCKYINSINSGFRRLNKNQIYFYEIKIHEFYPYHIYTSDNKKQIAVFSEKYFKTLFIDVKDERKRKLEKIYKLYFN